jgi:hypothetical protein
MSPNVIATWTLATAFIAVILAAVAYCRYLLHTQPRSTDAYGFVVINITTPLPDATTPDSATNRTPAYLDLSVLRPPDDMST